jgi:hypothetical protein
VRYREQSDLRTSGSNKLHGIPRSGLASSLVGMEVRTKDNEKAATLRTSWWTCLRDEFNISSCPAVDSWASGTRLISIPLERDSSADADYR